MAEQIQRSEVTHEVTDIRLHNNMVNDSTNIKHVFHSDNSDMDCRSLNSENWNVVKEDLQHVYEIHSVKAKPGVIPETENEACYDVNKGFKIKHEKLDEDSIEPVFVNINSKHKVVCKEDTNLLYENHAIKEELVLGPETIQEYIDKMPLCPKSMCDENKITNIFICNHCDKKFHSSSQLRCHMKTIQKKCNKTINVKSYKHMCNTCGRRFCMKSSLLKHIKTHKKPNENADKICGCGNIFASAQNLMRHINSIHAGEKPYRCNECGKSYSGKGDLQCHYLKMHPSSDFNSTAESNLVFCQFCNKPFVGKTHCSHHENYRCLQNKNKKDKKPLTSKSTLPPQFSCDICQKKYRYISTLNQHLKIHLGIRPAYQCDDCNKTYTKKANLKSHILSKHMNLRVYSCDKCKKSYTSLWGLKCHKRKPCPQPHQCTICHRHFKNYKNLSKHTKEHCTSSFSAE